MIKQQWTPLNKPTRDDARVGLLELAHVPRVEDVGLDDGSERPKAVVRRDVGQVAPDVREEPVTFLEYCVQTSFEQRTEWARWWEVGVRQSPNGY